jgi:NADH-quinone oxidoreductase subunit M
MGSYGLVRICVGFFPDAIIALSTVLMALGSFNIVWAAAACLVQDDMKRVIALSSVSHMGFILLGIGSLTAAGLSGAIFQMISHGFISALLFFMVGTIYERCHTRSIPTIGGGLANETPRLFYFWMFAALANLGLPALSGFVGEATVIYGAIVSPTVVSTHALIPRASIIIACTGVILTAGYMLWLLKRLFYGEPNPKWIGHFGDASPREIQIASMLAVFILALGVYPMMITNFWSNYTDHLALDLRARNMADNISLR